MKLLSSSPITKQETPMTRSFQSRKPSIIALKHQNHPPPSPTFQQGKCPSKSSPTQRIGLEEKSQHRLIWKVQGRIAQNFYSYQRQIFGGNWSHVSSRWNWGIVRPESWVQQYHSRKSWVIQKLPSGRKESKDNEVALVQLWGGLRILHLQKFQSELLA